jgi:hypothetical protein
VSLFRRRPPPPAPPARQPASDPRVEAQLQQVISLRRAAGRNETALDQCAGGIAELTDTMVRHPTSAGHMERRYEVERLQREIGRLNRETAEYHAQIQEIIAKLSDDDLIWLEPSPPRRLPSGELR